MFITHRGTVLELAYQYKMRVRDCSIWLNYKIKGYKQKNINKYNKWIKYDKFLANVEFVLYLN